MKLKIYLLTFFCYLTCFSQLKLKGVVNDEFGMPLPFVNVFVQGTTFGSITDEEGRFAFVCKQKQGTIEISFVGFQTKTLPIDPSKEFYTITLKEGADVLDEIVIVSKPKKRLKKKENPAYKILKEVWKKKRKNGLKLVKSYQFKKHTTTELGLNNLDSTFIKTLFKEDYKKTIQEIKYDSDGTNYYIPIFMREQIAMIYGNNTSNKVRQDIIAEKEDGLGAQNFAFDRMANTFREIDIFKNNVVFLRKSFVSPISSDGFATYDYVLYDSIVQNNEKLYNIYFFPIRDNDLAFKGNLWISNKNFSLKKIKMKVGKSANINFVRELSLEKEFELKNDSLYLPTKNRYEGDFTLVDKKDNSKGFTVIKTETFENYLLDRTYSQEFYEAQPVKIRPDQYEKEDDYWAKINKREDKETYKIINSVKGKRKIKNITGVLNTLASGNLQVGNFQIGPLWTIFSYNEVEGFKTRLGFKTFKTKNDRFRLSGNFSYGFKDEKVRKFGLEAQYLLSYDPRISIRAALQNDAEQLGSSLLNTSQLLGRTFGGVALFSRGTNFFISNVRRYGTNFDYAFHPNLHFGVNFNYANIESASPDKFNIDYIDQSGKIQSRVVDTSSDIYLSYTPGRNVYGLGVVQQFGRNIYPSLVINYRHGYKGAFGGTHDYDKIQIRYSHPIPLGKFGILDTTIEGGKTFGTVPLSLLSPIPASQSYSLVRNTFTLMNYYDFITDTYAATHIEHHFNGFIMNRIPLINKLNLRSLVTFRAAYGTISDANRAINKSNITYNTPDKRPYLEYGFGLENIGFGNFRVLRVDAIWRSDFTSSFNSLADPAPKFAIRLAVKPGL